MFDGHLLVQIHPGIDQAKISLVCSDTVSSSSRCINETALGPNTQKIHMSGNWPALSQVFTMSWHSVHLAQSPHSGQQQHGLKCQQA